MSTDVPLMDFNSSHRQVATFFLGFVFISSIHFAIHVPISILSRLRNLLLGHRPSPLDSPIDEKVNTWLGSSASSVSSFPPRPITNNLVLGLTLCFAMASVAEFGSLLVFDRQHGLAGCAFLVAWSGMAGQSAKLLGLLKLSLDLKKMGVKRWETYAFWAWLAMALIIMFVSNAISVGAIHPIRGSRNANNALCLRDRHVAVSVLSTVVDVIMEVYCFIRISYLVVPAFLSPQHKVEAFLDVRVARALTLLMLDIATAAPSAMFFDVLADTLPYSIVALLVLSAFNHRSPETTLATTASIPLTRAESHRSRSTIEITKMPSTRSLRQTRVSHPFAASALSDPSPETEDWPASAAAATLAVPEPVMSPGRRRSKQRRSSLLSESDSDIARSVKGAVVGFAFRDVVGNGQGHGQRRGKQVEKSFLPPIPTRTARAELVPPPASSKAVRSPTPQIEVTRTSPVSSTDSDDRSPNISSRPSLSISMPDPSHNPSVKTTSSSTSSGASAKSSMHLTPSTHGPPSFLPSRRTSSSMESEYPAESRRTSGVSNSNSSDASLVPVPMLLLPPADDDLSIVYEASHEDSDSVGLPPSRAARPTTFGRDAFVSMDSAGQTEREFGEDMFIEGGIGRHIPSPLGVPEDVVERHGAGSGSSGSP
ncbi:hypothetical protein BU17DRAFT_80400 [Hysterangium stoloniferum]|nr:hypothetical protein BU17DRAFT_80400 [Hysterangium stoloniferum]